MDVGTFLGGFQQGMADRRQSDREDEKLALERQDAEAKIKLAQDKQNLELRTEANKVFNDVLSDIKETADALRAAGRSQDEIEAAVSPLAERAVSFGGRFGQDPELIAARIQSIAGRPSEPQTELGKLEADRRAGYISEDVYRQKLEGLSKGSGTTINVGGASDKAFATELNKAFANEFTEQRKSAIDAVASIKSNDEALKLLDSGIITGTGADYILQVGKALQQAGINLAPDAIANTEAFVATRAQEVGRIIKLFGAGTGLSDKDREFATRAAAGEISLTESSIRRVLEINAKASRNIVRAYNNTVSQLDPSIVPFDLRLPEVPSATAEQPIIKTINGVKYERRDGVWFKVGG